MLLNPDNNSELQQRINGYAACVKELNDGKSPKLPQIDAADPLAKLNHELRLLADKLTRRETELVHLFQVVHKAEGGLRVEDVLSQIFDGFSEIIPYDRIGCAFLSDGGTQLKAYWARTNLGPIQIGKGYAQVLKGSSLQEVFRTGEPRILNDLPAYLAAHLNSDSTGRIVLEGGRSSLTCPLFVNGHPLGMLFFTSRKTDTYSGTHQALFRQIADAVATVIHKSRLFQDLVENNHFLLLQTEQLRIEGNRDPLTGLLNRRAMMEALNQQLHAVQVFGTPLGVIMADIDHFKRINDTYGHAAGDKALCEFTRRLKDELRPNDFFCRYGGEEFLILVPDTHREQLMQVANRLRRAIADTTFDFGMVRQTVTASFGVSIADLGVRDVDRLLEGTDRALYAAKTAGRNCCEAAT
jgi:diguanylate cyclase (GGDEF)-like protein